MSDLSTPRPWKNDRYGFLCGANGKGVEVWGLGIAHSMRDETTEANAELIVKAVNSYDAMVEALEAVYAGVSDRRRKELDSPSNSTVDRMCAILPATIGSLRKVKSALALARGEKAVR